ncbi:protein kinase domain-containing protein [Ditylenchus destructor]|uniref:mitogen-activated protein kinase kinase kinase n=1 Tax=Ditylenchus destructor TaxID=166010 RepID=A0AAD4NIR1_9BILA|nr:protein kinase domain-containing protein [Ditylenchus destructor]
MNSAISATDSSQHHYPAVNSGTDMPPVYPPDFSTATNVPISNSIYHRSGPQSLVTQSSFQAHSSSAQQSTSNRPNLQTQQTLAGAPNPMSQAIPGTSSAQPTVLAASGRRLQIVLVLDKKVQKSLKVREMACVDIESVCQSLNVNLQLIDIDRLDFGETKSLDTFYNADIALVDFTITHQQPSLCYHVGVRESMGQNYNIIIMYFPDEKAEVRIMDALKKTLTNLHLITYFLSEKDSPVLLSADKSYKLERLRDQMGDRFNPQKALKKGRSVVTFADRIKQALTNVTIEANAHAREKFLSDLRKVRDIENTQEANKFLECMRTRLDNPDVLSVDTVHQMLLCLRDTQNYDAMISLIEDLERIGQKQIVYAQAVRFLYAFALNRRNKEGDRDKALETVVQIIDTNKSVSPDVICLAGRVYKDKFIASNYEDKEALDKAIEWYRKAFNISPLEYSGINLTTMLRARGEQFEQNVELQQIAVVLNSLLGRKGALSSMNEYWDVATFFEVSVLAEDYNKACQAAQKMAMLKPPAWFLKSTMENIKLISRCAATLSPVEKDKKTFLFWTDFFMEAIEANSGEVSSTRFPVLIQEINKQHTPSYLTVNSNDVILSHVMENSRNKKPPPGTHRWEFKAANIKAVSASKRDDRSMFMYVHENSDDFNLTFPSAVHCNRVIEMIMAMEGGCEKKILHGCEAESHLEFEYELDSNGDRIVLGRGTYGVVYSARDITTQRSIVVKEVEVKNEEEVQPLMEEIQLHSTLSHDNIVQYLGSKLEKREHGNVFLIFMEHVPGGSLSSLLRSKWGPLDNEQTMAFYARQILEGLKYLHEQKIVHRDIKGENVLVNTYSGLCKISDFGTCKRLAGLNPIADTFKGTLQYMAPEVIDHGQRGYGAPADIWSFGCTMIEMATGKTPFIELGCGEAALFKVGMHKIHPPIPALSDLATAFIKSCFEPDAEKRSKARDLIRDPFIQQYYSKRTNSSTKKRVDATGDKNASSANTAATSGRRTFNRASSHLGGIGLGQNSTNLGSGSPAGGQIAISRSNSTKHPSTNVSHVAVGEEAGQTPSVPTAIVHRQTRSSENKLSRPINERTPNGLRLRIEPCYPKPTSSASQLTPVSPLQCASASPNLGYTSITSSNPATLAHPSATFEGLSYQMGGACRHHHICSQQHNSTTATHQMANTAANSQQQQSSQPSSPLREHCPSIHTPLTASPSLCESSPFLSIPPNTSLSIPEENSMANRFFTLQKESERRTTLASLMREHEAEIIDKWWEQFTAEIHDDEIVLINRDMMRQLLNGLRVYLVPNNKETAPGCDSLQSTIRQICREISPNNEPMPISQLMLALYVFPNAVQPSLKLQGIKPHWMFTLDDLIRNSVQQALKLIQPVETAVRCVHEVQGCGNQMIDQASSSNEIMDGASCVSGIAPIGMAVDAMGNLHPYAAFVGPELSQQHRFYSDHIRRLFEEMINVEKETKDLLEVSLMEKQFQLRQLSNNVGITSPGGVNGHGQPTFNHLSSSSGISVSTPTMGVMESKSNIAPSSSSCNILPRGSNNIEGPADTSNDDLDDDDESLKNWLIRIGCDSYSIELLERQRYTKRDVIDFVSREELMNTGISGGMACRIWREILRSRLESSQKFDGATALRKYPNRAGLSAFGSTSGLSTLFRRDS